VHYVDLDHFVDTNYVVTVHGPNNPVVERAVNFRVRWRGGHRNKDLGKVLLAGRQ
jgi:hypothetical protein